MAQIIDPMATLQSYQTANQLNAMRQQEMELSRLREGRQAQLHPLEMQVTNMNMLAKRMAMEDDMRKRNALQQFGATGNMNALAQADPAAFAKYRLGLEELKAKQWQPGKPQWDSARGVWVTPPTIGAPGMMMGGTGGSGGFMRPGNLPPTAGEIKEQKEKEKQNLELLRSIDKTQRTLQQIDEMIGTEGVELQPGQKKVKPHAGFRGAVGSAIPGIDGWTIPGLRYYPGSAESDFESRHKQITGKAFLQAFESLKGGGQITEIEGRKATEAINRMDLAQSEAEYVKAAREFQDEVKALIDIAKKRSGITAPADGQGAGDLTPEEQRELQQLRQRFGGRK